MTKDQEQNVLKVLEHIQKRPGMYVSPQTPAISNFMNGFNLAFRLLNPGLDFTHLYDATIRERGWVFSSRGVISQMEEKGFGEQAIVDELIAIQISLLEKLARQTIVLTTESE